ncbi:hypothetical protein [Paludisphaera soli]|uniref:hypothetical protein n=1 Tax=Paludisphaera soli TaxID=2712865 RepID=UPI0013EBC582|nr:hypothetical protein [Paludisphaera soli]
MDVWRQPDSGELAWIADQDRWFAEHRLPSGTREVEPDLFEGRELHVYADPDLRLRDVGYYRPGPPAG